MDTNIFKKILLITRPLAPPWDEASKNFAYYLAKNSGGTNLTILVDKINDDLPPNVRQEKIYTSNNWSFFQKLKSLIYQIENRNKFDVTHYLFTSARLNSFFIRNFIKRKHIKAIQTIATLREDLYSDKEIKKSMFGDLVITYSDYAKNRLNGLGLKNVERVYPGIDLDYFKPAPKNNKLLTSYGLQESDFIVAYPGEYIRLGATDDITSMILQYSSILKEKNIKIIFACRLKNNADILKKEAVMRKLKESNCLDRVIFTDTVSDIASLYNLADVIIFPVQNMQGKFDVPLAAVESMACEKPVIVSDLPILKEFARAENSVTIKRGNVQQLKSAILDLYEHPEKRASIGQAGRKFCEENFDIKKIAEIYKKIYKSL